MRTLERYLPILMAVAFALCIVSGMAGEIDRDNPGAATGDCGAVFTVPEAPLVVMSQATVPQEPEERKLLTPEPEDDQLSGAEVITLEATGYTANKESTGKSKGHPEYGITASGAKAKRGVTVAMGKAMPMGTRVFIPYFEELWGNGWFEVQDRGGAITNSHIDIFFGYDKRALAEALDFGRREVEVYVVRGDS